MIWFIVYKTNDDCFFTTIVFENLKRFGDMEFDISKHVLDIVYSQTICWFAIFFSPLISVLTMVKIFLVFYLRLFFVKYVSICKRNGYINYKHAYIFIYSPLSNAIYTNKLKILVLHSSENPIFGIKSFICVQGGVIRSIFNRYITGC